MAQKYYNVSETAKLLAKTPEEVKKMLERHELHGYRDGATGSSRSRTSTGSSRNRPRSPRRRPAATCC